MSLFFELKRRNVFRVALLYLVASWLIIQVADVGISLLGLPLWTGRLVFLLLAIGFPLVMVFSWAYEITPEGLRKEKEVERNESITADTARKLNTAVIILLLLSLGGMVADRLIPEVATTVETAAIEEPENAGPPERSIAVLPFVNMSADQENEYFSDGLSEELLNLLAKIPELQVAARTSAFSFKGADDISVPEIASKLNVAHVLEGSVRKSGDEIRITAQLIKASDGYHLWSETWDRKLTDVFAIQDEIAAAVVDVLKVTLLGEAPHARVTDPRAYELYLQAKAIDNARTREAYEEGIRLLKEALAIDPEYAEAWTELSTLITNQTGSGYLPWNEGFARAKEAAGSALEIDPQNARAMANIGWIAMYRDRDYAEAVRRIGEARRLEPGNASVLNAFAVLNGHFGRVQTARSIYLEALSIDPLAMSILANTAGVNFSLERYDDMGEMIERMREVDADSLYADIYEGWRAYGMGNAELALDIFDRIDDLNSVWARAFPLYDLGRDEEVLKGIETLKEAGSRSVQVASIYAYLGDADNAFEWLERGYEDGDDDLVEIRQYTAFKPIEDDPRWELILEKIGISDANANRIGL